MDVSLITSLYRTETHLPTFIRHAQVVAAQVQTAGISLEFIVVANDATEAERTLLNDYSAADSSVKVLHVPRESLYASWNRGVAAASGAAIGFWNVDDIRTAEGIIEGYRRIGAGCPLVYFSHTVIRTDGKREQRRTYPAVPYDPELHRRVMKCGPFFMFAPSLYQQVGIFDARFQIVGDWEWCARATAFVEFCTADVIAGYFLLHGGNLSDTGNPLQTAEENMVYLLQGAYHRLIPTDPDVMRKTWEKWSLPLPQEIEQRLWGEGAAARFQAWRVEKQRVQRHAQFESAVRYLPKQVIDRTGLRPYLAKLGIVKNRPKK